MRNVARESENLEGGEEGGAYGKGCVLRLRGPAQQGQALGVDLQSRGVCPGGAVQQEAVQVDLEPGQRHGHRQVMPRPVPQRGCWEPGEHRGDGLIREL